MNDLAPGFLIASPPLGDPNFERTVVLLVLHGPAGALGFVVNRIAPLKIGEVLGLAGYDSPGLACATGDVFVGGPVEPGSGWVLARTPELLAGAEGALQVVGGVGVSSSKVAFDALARDVEHGGAALAERMVFLGYSGWGPGQLEGEIARGAWLPAPFDPSVLFDVAVEARPPQAPPPPGL